MKRLLFLTVAWLLFSNSYSQQFAIKIDKGLNKRIVQFIDQRTPVQIPIIIRKTSYLDSSKESFIEIGLSIIISSIPLDILMTKEAVIKFTDNTNLVFYEQISSVYLYSGNHQIFANHVLNPKELFELQSKKILSIKISEYEHKINKFYQDQLMTLFKDIELK